MKLLRENKASKNGKRFVNIFRIEKGEEVENTVLPFSLGKYHYIIPINTGMLCGPHSSASIGIIYSKSVRSKRQRTNCLLALRKVKYIDSDERRGKVYQILCQPLTFHSPTIRTSPHVFGEPTKKLQCHTRLHNV